MLTTKFAALAFVLTVAINGTAAGQRSPDFAKDGRIVTIENWGRHEATVWAVQADCIVAYTVSDTAESAKLIVRVPISKEQSETIQASVSAIPQKVRGHVYMPRGVLDGAMLRISFTADGHYSSDRIEVQNLWLPWLSAVTEAISEAMPQTAKIRFREQIERRNRMLNWRADWPTEVIPIDKYYEAPQPPSSPPPANASR